MVLASLLFFTLLSAAACDDEGGDEPAVPADATYTVRGRVSDITGNDVSIAHEAIPDFVNREGETVGMESMTMAFHRPDGVSLDGIDVNDAVEITFEVRFQSAEVLTITAIRRLPADTALGL
jgi:Cu/Ag efflux protein CusF